MPVLLQLCIQFFKAGLFSVGGGLATLPFLYEMSDRYGWFSFSDIADMIAISECTPGGIGLNMATYAGYVTSGAAGGILATLSLAAPCVIVILIIARILERFRDNPLVDHAFYGLRAASVAMISTAGIHVARTCLIHIHAWKEGGLLGVLDLKAIILAVLLFFGLRKLKWHPITFLALSAVIGVVFRF
ncbi:MAG: chromate transporter [Clostridium sp.]|nr:chromate transporter [Clostridium sp.]